MYKVGIIGCGLVAEGQHIPAFLKLRDKVTIQAVCDRDISLVRRVATKYEISGAYIDFERMLSMEKLDIAVICTPPQTHILLALQAIEHGCHVLLEKPMALKATDCDLMIEAAARRGVKLCVVHNMLFNPLILGARQLVDAGAIGTLTGVRLLLSDPKEGMILKQDHWIHKLPGGVLGETGPHAVYTSLAFLRGVAGVEVYAKSILEHSWAPFDEFSIELEGKRAVSSVTVSYATNRRNFYLDLLGTEGALYLDVPSFVMVRQGRKDSMGALESLRYLSDTAWQTARSAAAYGFARMTGKLEYGHAVLIRQFVDGLANGGRLPVTGEEGRDTVRVMESIVRRLNAKYGAVNG